MSMDGVMVANAALAEVGMPQTATRKFSPTGKLTFVVGGASTSPIVRGLRLTYRAVILAGIAERGPDHLARCHDCARGGFGRGTVPCTPARDALRGITCGLWGGSE